MTVAYRTSVAGGNTAGTAITTAITALTGDLLIVAVSISGIAATSAAYGSLTDDASGTYTLVGIGKDSVVDPGIAVYIRNQLVAAGATITASLPATGNTSGAMVVTAVSGMTRSGITAIRAAGDNNFKAAAPAATMNRIPLTTNFVYGAAASQDTTTTEPSGWTERQDTSQITPTSALEVATRDSGHTTALVTWGAVSSNDGYCVVLELDASPVAELVLLNKQTILLGGTYVPTSGTKAVKLDVIGGGGGGGAGTTVTGAAGGGGASGEWANIWYRSGSNIAGGLVTIGAGGASASIGSSTSIVIDGLTFTAIGGSAGNTSAAVASYAEADAVALGSSGSVGYDISRGSASSISAMATETTTISGYSGGLGGNTPYGHGGRGSGGDAVGDNGSGYGTGGGGGRRGAATNRNGGTGGQGAVIIEEYGAMVTVTDIADAVWNALRSTHVGAGSFGENVIADTAKWSGTAVAAPTTAGVPRVDVKAMEAGVLTATAIAATGRDFLTTDFVAYRGTVAAAAASTVTLDAGASAVASIYIGARVVILSGTGVGQSRLIRAYTAARVATVVPNWTTTPAAADTLIVVHNSGMLQDGGVTTTAMAGGSISNTTISAGTISSGKFATDAIDSNALAATAVTEIQTGLATSTAVTALDTKLGTPAGASVSVDIAAVKTDTTGIKAKTDSLTFTVANKVDANTTHFGGTVAPAPTVAGVPKVEVASIANNAITAASINSAAITAAKFATDAVDSNALAASAVTEIQSGLATSAALSTAQTSLNSINAKTTNLPSDPADESLLEAAIAAVTAPSAAAIADAVLDESMVGHNISGTFGEIATRAPGLAHENALDDNWVYTGGQLTSLRRRVFATSAATTAAVAGAADGANGEIARYTLTWTYSGLDVATFKWIRTL